MNKKKIKKILVVLGGTSGERAVSLESGMACVNALKKKGYKVSTFDPKVKNTIIWKIANSKSIFYESLILLFVGSGAGIISLRVHQCASPANF